MLALALLATTAGLLCFAISMERHWRQLLSRSLSPRLAGVLRAAGAALLAISLALCLGHDHATMAALVWMMLLALGALAVAMFFAWQRR